MVSRQILISESSWENNKKIRILHFYWAAEVLPSVGKFMNYTVYLILIILRPLIFSLNAYVFVSLKPKIELQELQGFLQNNRQEYQNNPVFTYCNV